MANWMEIDLSKFTAADHDRDAPLPAGAVPYLSADQQLSLYNHLHHLQLTEPDLSPDESRLGIALLRAIRGARENTKTKTGPKASEPLRPITDLL